MDITYTTADYQEFKKLYFATGSHNQVKRIAARMDMNEFISKHGRDKCDAMFDKMMTAPHLRESEGAEGAPA